MKELKDGDYVDIIGGFWKGEHGTVDKVVRYGYGPFAQLRDYRVRLDDGQQLFFYPNQLRLFYDDTDGPQISRGRYVLISRWVGKLRCAHCGQSVWEWDRLHWFPPVPPSKGSLSCGIYRCSACGVGEQVRYPNSVAAYPFKAFSDDRPKKEPLGPWCPSDCKYLRTACDNPVACQMREAR